MFGFQRVGDLIWAAGDSQARGFLIGATAGRTTLNGEGLQHQDGHSHILANTVPNCKSYDAAYSYELTVIIQDGVRRMYKDKENCFYYLTTMNENYSQPVMSEGAEEGIIRGIYSFSRGADTEPKVQLMGSGAILNEVREAATILRESFSVESDIWSLTSVNELTRDGQETDRWNLLHPGNKSKKSYITEQMEGSVGPVVIATDYMKNHAEQLRKYIQFPLYVLGTDGFGRSDSRATLRNFFEVDRYFIVLAGLKMLADEGKIKTSILAKAMKKFGIDPEKPNPLYV
jgi:pyruvate dehydrogenase E1 component